MDPPLAWRWICKSTSAPAPSLQPSPCVWYANETSIDSSPHFPSSFPFALLLLHKLAKEEQMKHSARERERERGFKNDNDVVMDGCYTNRHVSNNEKPGWLENNKKQSRRELRSGGVRTKLWHLWRSLCFSLVNHAATTQPCPTDILSAIMSSEVDTSQSQWTSFCCSMYYMHAQMCTSRMQEASYVPGRVAFALSWEMDGVLFQRHCSQSKSRGVLWFIKDEMGQDLFLPPKKKKIPSWLSFCCFDDALSECMNTNWLFFACYMWSLI